MFSVIVKILLFIGLVSVIAYEYVIRKRQHQFHNFYFMRPQRPNSSNYSYSMKTQRPYNRSMVQDDRKLWWSVVGGLKDTPLGNFGRQDFFKKNIRQSKVILRVGDENFNYNRWRDGSDHLRRMNCPITNCIFTNNWSSFKNADALVISEFRKAELKFFTPKPKGQIWITHHIEPPYHNRINVSLLNGLINWTATYRLDSTFAMPYYFWSEIDQPEEYAFETKNNYAQGKTRKVAMMVSNCHSMNGRVEYAKELNKTISVDIYGKCGSKTCNFTKINEKYACYKMLHDDYKFYLSFENSNCRHYITEKLHLNALGNDVIPIVMGARKEDYALVAPPGSYIHVDDFESPRHLGEYLNLLDNNDTLYNEYFRYKRRFFTLYPPGGHDSTWCQICIRLHLIDYLNLPRTWYDDYGKWWNDVCATQNDGNNSWKTWKGSS